MLLLTLKAWPIVTLLTIGLSYLTLVIAGQFGISLESQNQIATMQSAAGFTWEFAILCFSVIVVFPVFEELFFRGLLYKLPTRRRDNMVLRLIVAFVSSAIFVFAHYPCWDLVPKGVFQLRPLDNAFVALFFFGLAQCWLYRKSGRIWCPMLNHALFNLTNLLLLLVVD